MGRQIKIKNQSKSSLTLSVYFLFVARMDLIANHRVKYEKAPSNRQGF